MSDLVQDVNLAVRADGVSIQAIDTSHVCLIAVKIDAEDASTLSSFACPPAGATLGVHVPNLIAALKLAAPDDAVVLRCAAADADTVSLAFVGAGEGARSAKVELRLMAIDDEKFDLPEPERAVRFSMASKDFSRAVRDLASVGDTVRVTFERDDDDAGGLTMTLACDGDIGSASIAFRGPAPAPPADADADVQASARRRTSMSFSLKHMASIAKAGALSDVVTLQTVDDMPVCVEYAMSARSSVKFYLAPKIEDGDGEDDGASSASACSDD
jgi:proliferating cell nuclear antigen